jgi:hypothetical protein
VPKDHETRPTKLSNSFLVEHLTMMSRAWLFRA